MSKLLRWGVVGCGDVVERKSGPSIFNAGGSEIVGVMRRDAAKAQPFADANNIPLCTDDPTAIIKNPEVDIVYVATPPSTHREYVLAAAAEGKHVLVEKPMGMSAAEDDDMIAACDATGVELFVAYYRRYQPHVLKIKELIAAGAIGEIISGQIDYALPPLTGWDPGWRHRPEISGGGLFVDIVSHRIDLMVELMGPPIAAVGHQFSFEPGLKVEDVAAMTIQFAGGKLCTVLGDFVSQRNIDRFVIAGTEGTISTDQHDAYRFTLTRGQSAEEFQFDKLIGPHLGLIRHIQDVLAGKCPNGCSGRDGQHTDQILDWVLRSSVANQIS